MRRRKSNNPAPENAKAMLPGSGMITLQLRELEADGVVSRHVFPEVPPRVEYELTDFGRSLKEILEQMQQWGSVFKARKQAEEVASEQ
ncbi:MAG: winged helix-turn-helix transcriptional regulator [Planctomycetota bacterium]